MIWQEWMLCVLIVGGWLLGINSCTLGHRDGEVATKCVGITIVTVLVTWLMYSAGLFH